MVLRYLFNPRSLHQSSPPAYQPVSASPFDIEKDERLAVLLLPGPITATPAQIKLFRVWYRSFLGTIFLLLIALVVCVSLDSEDGPTVHPAFRPVTPKLYLQPWLARSFGQYAPWSPAQEYVPPPQGCRVDQVNILQRHGARYPTVKPAEYAKKAYERLKRVPKYANPALDFIHTWEWSLGTESLVPFGAAQSFDAGQQAFARYAALVSRDNLPFVRSTDDERVDDSCRAWTAGFTLASTGAFSPNISVFFHEGDKPYPNPLHNQVCGRAGHSEPTKQWTQHFAQPIADELNRQAPGADLSALDVANLMGICPFDTVVREAESPWCRLFSKEQWEQWEYLGDLGKFYSTGYGSELGRVQGVGYVNELLARLTGEPVKDATSTDPRLDSSPATFPLDRGVYADFSHDNQMTAIYAALGLFPATDADMDPLHPVADRAWRAARLVPFSARMVTERLQCATSDAREEGQYVRVLVNDAVQPLPNCDGAQDGVCSLKAFVKSQAYARDGAQEDWKKCEKAGSK